LFGVSEPFHSSRYQNVVEKQAALRYSNGTIVFKKTFSQQTLDAQPITMHDD
jgi:hypothetical protein